MALTTIYGICDPEFPYWIRYVGKSMQDMKIRMRWHRNMAVRKPWLMALYPWLADLASAGIRAPWRPLAQIEGSVEDGLRMESWIIKECRRLGHILLNHTDGGYGLNGFSHSAETKLKMGKSRKEIWKDPDVRFRTIRTLKATLATPKYREQRRVAATGRHHSDETKAILSIRAKERHQRRNADGS